MAGAPDSRLWKKLLWFGLLWAIGVAAVALLGFLIRTFMPTA